MTRLFRDDFLKQFQGKSIDVQQAERNQALDLRAKNAVRDADRNEDGIVSTPAELNALFTNLDKLEKGEGSFDHIRTSDARGATPLGRTLAALKEVAQQAPTSGGSLRRLVENKPHIKTNQQLINHCLRIGGNDWSRGQRIAHSFGTDLNDLAKNADALIDLGPEPISEAAPPPARPVADEPVIEPAAAEPLEPLATDPIKPEAVAASKPEVQPSPVQQLGGSVGARGKNHPADVAKVQQALEERGFLKPGSYEPGVLDATKSGDATLTAIKRFQGEYTSFSDGRIDVEGKSHDALRDAAHGHEYEVRPDETPLSIIRDAFKALVDGIAKPLNGEQQQKILDLTVELNPNAQGLKEGQIASGDAIELPSTELIRERLELDTAFQQTKPEERTYTVRGGDSLSTIAKAHGVSLASLRAANPQITNPRDIKPRQLITIPASGAAAAASAGYPVTDFTPSVYAPFSSRAIALFSEAARQAGLPESWARSNALHNLIAKESGGKVGVPNYSYKPRSLNEASWPEIHAELRAGKLTGKIVKTIKLKNGRVRNLRSSATGLGQLTLPNVRNCYPSGVAGIGDPMEEAIGMLRYIKRAYGNPENAWRKYGTNGEGY